VATASTTPTCCAAAPTSQVLGHRVMAPSTLGTFLRSFTFGHVRQLDQLTEQFFTCAWGGWSKPR
jgi:hypothetical protein